MTKITKHHPREGLTIMGGPMEPGWGWFQIEGTTFKAGNLKNGKEASICGVDVTSEDAMTAAITKLYNKIGFGRTMTVAETIKRRRNALGQGGDQ